jgi:hypothetical protein
MTVHETQMSITSGLEPGIDVFYVAVPVYMYVLAVFISFLTTGVCFPAGAGIFLFATASRHALEPTQPPIQ